MYAIRSYYDGHGQDEQAGQGHVRWVEGDGRALGHVQDGQDPAAEQEPGPVARQPREQADEQGLVAEDGEDAGAGEPEGAKP